MLGNDVSVMERLDLWEKFREPAIYRIPGFTLAGVKQMMGTDMQMDRVAIVEVTSAGPGIEVNDKFKPNYLKVGDIGLINGMMVGRCITVHGRQHWGIPNHKVFAVLDNFDAELPRPMEGHIFTQPNQRWMQYEYTGTYGMPIAFDDEGTVAAGNGVDPRRVAYEEVIAVADDVKGVPIGALVAIPKDHACDSFVYRGRGFNSIGKNKVTAVIARPEDKPADLYRVVI